MSGVTASRRTNCPSCGRDVMAAPSHCSSLYCEWRVCCGLVISRTGRFFQRKDVL